MVMHLSDNRGFLLIDALISILITTSICILCMSIFSILINYSDSLDNYLMKDNDYYLNLFNHTAICEGCINHESD